MDEGARERLALSLQDYVWRALHGWRAYDEGHREWIASGYGPRFAALIRGEAGEQAIDIVAVSAPAHLDRLGRLVSDVVHPLRVAYDNVERAKRKLDLAADEWPPVNPAWAAVRAADNAHKHELHLPVTLWVVEATVTVHTAINGPVVGEIAAEIVPRKLPDKPPAGEGVVVHQIASVPQRWRGEGFAYGISFAAELRFGATTRAAAGLPVDQTLGLAMTAAHDLLRVVSL